MSEPAIAIAGLSKSFGPGRGVFDVSFAVEPGEIFGFLGPNGAGKTTLIRVLLGYLRPERGEVRVFGHDGWRESRAIRRRIGYVPAEFKLDEEGSALALFAYLAGYRPAGALERAKQLAERLDLRLDGKIRRYSKGMKQKVALIQALMHDPELLILDEPSEGLDPLIQNTLHALLREAAAAGRTVFFSSHVLAEVERLCDRVAIIGEGRLLALEHLRTLRDRRDRLLQLVFSAPYDAVGLALPNARFVEQRGLRATFRYAGAAADLLPRLVALPLADFTLEPAPLEDAFLAYYQ